MTWCSENVHRLIVERRRRHFGHPTLDAHVTNAIAKPTPRDWRLVGEAARAREHSRLAIARGLAENLLLPIGTYVNLKFGSAGGVGAELDQAPTVVEAREF